MSKTFFQVLVNLILLAGPAQATDTLFERMQGTWHAQGERTQFISGRKTHIEARVQAQLQGDLLRSHSELTETPDAPGLGAPRTYARDYWIRATAPGSYELGVGDKVTAVGHFDGSVLSVEQNLGGEAAYLVRSQTHFDATGSQYDEVFWSGTRKLAETHLRYWLAE